jgi:hypothetical protein
MRRERKNHSPSRREEIKNNFEKHLEIYCEDATDIKKAKIN